MKLIYKLIAMTIAAVLLASCGIPGLVQAPANLPGLAVSGPLIVGAPANATATPTPFQPLPVTSTYIPTGFPTLTPTPTSTSTQTPTATYTPTPKGPVAIARSFSDYPGPIIQPDIPIPEPVGILEQPKNQVNILLLGSDQRPDDYGFRTDTIVLVTINPDQGTVNMTSYPRDLYVYIPGWTIQRINTAMAHGGFDLLAQTFEYNFGVKPEYYAFINFGSFKEVVDSLDGVDVQVAQPLTDHMDKVGDYTVYAGTNHMDGELALWYSRARYTTNDFSRNRRQQEVLMAIFKKLLSLNALTRIPQLWDIYHRNVTTNLSLDLALTLLPAATKMGDSSGIQHYYISPEDVIPYLNINGSQVLIPKRESVLAVMYQALNVEIN